MPKILYSQKATIESHPQKVMKKNKTHHEILKTVTKESYRGQSIGKLAVSLFYTIEETMIKELVDELNENNDLLSLAVVDSNLVPMGIIVRKELFDILGKPYGKEVLENKFVKKCVIQVKIFNEHRNIFSVVNELGNQIEKNKTERYLIVNEHGQFKGIFTNIDLLSYLSDMTQKDITMAKNLQINLVKPKTYFQEKNFDFIAHSNMAKEVGGDFYYYKNYSPNHWVFSLCDVSGKGVAAAMITAVLGGVFSIFDFKHGLHNFIGKLNQFILSTFNSDRFLTGVFIKFDAETGKTNIFDMGHSYLYLYRNDKFLRIKCKNANFPVGIMDELSINSIQLNLEKGDIIIAFTDGIIEQTNERDEEYSISNIPKFLKKYKGEALNISIEDMFQDIHQFKGKEPLHDDMTLILIHYK